MVSRNAPIFLDNATHSAKVQPGCARLAMYLDLINAALRDGATGIKNMLIKDGRFSTLAIITLQLSQWA